MLDEVARNLAASLRLANVERRLCQILVGY